MPSFPKLTKTNSIIGWLIIAAGLTLYMGGCKKSTFDALVAKLPFTKDKKEKSRQEYNPDGDNILDRDDAGGPWLPAGTEQKKTVSSKADGTSRSSNSSNNEKPKIDYSKYENNDFEETQNRTAVAHIIKVYRSTMDMHNSRNKNEENVVWVAIRVNKNFDRLSSTNIWDRTNQMMRIFKKHRRNSDIESVVYNLGMLGKGKDNEYHRGKIHAVLAQHHFDSDTYWICRFFLDAYNEREKIK